MKKEHFVRYVNETLRKYPSFKSPLNILLHLLFTNGNGYEYHRGEIADRGYHRTDLKVPLTTLYKVPDDSPTHPFNINEFYEPLHVLKMMIDAEYEVLLSVSTNFFLADQLDSRAHPDFINISKAMAEGYLLYMEQRTPGKQKAILRPRNVQANEAAVLPMYRKDKQVLEATVMHLNLLLK